MLRARELVCRTVETMVGPVQLERPYFYCRACRSGVYPLDEVLGLVPGRKQLDMQKAGATLVTEVPYDEAQTLFGALTGVPVGSERIHTLTNQVAQALTVLDVAPPREEIKRRVAAVAAGRWRRPVVVLGIDGAYVPTRPVSARERRPGPRGKRARIGRTKALLAPPPPQQRIPPARHGSPAGAARRQAARCSAALAGAGQVPQDGGG